MLYQQFINNNQPFAASSYQSTLPVNLYDNISKDIGVVTPGKTILLYGEPIVYHFGSLIMEKILKHIDSIAVVDGANRFDLYGLTGIAQINNLDPWKFLDRIFISRIFTGYQLDAVINNGVSSILKSINSRVMVVIGILNTLFDDQMPVRQAKASLVRIRNKFKSLKNEGISIVLISEHICPQQWNRRQLTKQMFEMLDVMYLAYDESVRPVELNSNTLLRELINSYNIEF
jgi:hypothetical protein